MNDAIYSSQIFDITMHVVSKKHFMLFEEMEYRIYFNPLTKSNTLLCHWRFESGEDIIMHVVLRNISSRYY